MQCLSLTKKFQSAEEYLQKGYEFSFNVKKNKLSFCKLSFFHKIRRLWRFSSTEKITDLQQIANEINRLDKPFFDKIEPFRNAYKNLKAFNSKIEANNKRLTTRILNCLAKFFGFNISPYSPINLKSFRKNLKPCVKELGEKIFAVHASRFLPQNDCLNPCIVSLATAEKQPGFCNTLHFSLGELVRPHDEQSWEKYPYAIVTPFKTIQQQCVNIFTYDTFITGKWEFRKESVLLVPEGTNLSLRETTPANTIGEIVFYNKDEKSLRCAIDEVIQTKNGLSFKMLNKSGALGSKAYLDEEININTIAFFENLLIDNPKISFGDHTHSLIGTASSLAVLRTCSYGALMKSSPTLKLIYYSMMELHLSRADQYLQVNEKFALRKIIQDVQQMIPASFQPNSDEIERHLSFDYFHSLNEVEFQEYTDAHPLFFNVFLPCDLKLNWAICRWLVIGYENGLKENLPGIINEKLSIKLIGPYFIRCFENILVTLFRTEYISLDQKLIRKHISELPVFNNYLFQPFLEKLYETIKVAV